MLQTQKTGDNGKVASNARSTSGPIPAPIHVGCQHDVYVTVFVGPQALLQSSPLL